MANGILKIASCQFAVGSSVVRNANRICEFLKRAKKAKADVVHFSECALSGYAGFDFKTLQGYDWQKLDAQLERVKQTAKRLKLWVVLGCMHKASKSHKPYNSLYLIGPAGEVEKRYDKRFCTPGDLEFFTPGNKFVTFTINKVKCAFLICFDLRFPELYRQLKKRKVDCIFQSFYNARQSQRSVHTDIMRQTMQCRAATNYFWISMTNSSAYYSPYPSCFISPDGRIARQLKFHKAGMMISSVDLNKQYYDATGPFRDLAIKGRLDNRK